jgi:hypothetical protein
MTDIKGLLKLAKRRQHTEDVCLRGDLAHEYDRLERQLAQLPANNKLGGDPERQRIAAEMDRVRAEMQAGTVPFVLHALPDADFQKLIDDHPPRRDGDEVNDRDAAHGFDRSTFYPALIRACVAEPTLDGEDWALLFDNPDTALSPGQMLKLREAALEVNGREVDVPFSPAASNVSPD